MSNNKYNSSLSSLLLSLGVNLQSGQPLVLSCSVEYVSLAREITKKAYEMGASEVYVRYTDDVITREGYAGMSEDTLANPHEFSNIINNEYAKLGACFLSISAPNPKNLEGIDRKKVDTGVSALSKLTMPYRKMAMANEVRWSLCCLPSPAWAKMMFPDLSEEAGMEKLWELVAKAMLLCEKDPLSAWKKHVEDLNAVASMLSAEKFEKFHITSARGTDLVVEMPKSAVFFAAAEKAKDGVDFIANMPTEEVFSAPAKFGANGVVHSALPLSYQGGLVEDFWFRFENGKVVDFSAKKGKEILAGLLKSDEGASYLGEIAFVDCESGIAKTGEVFFNTLFDENASCHLALGNAYDTCAGEEDDRIALNESKVHVDFMHGDSTTKVVGIKGETQTTIMQNGRFVLK